MTPEPSDVLPEQLAATPRFLDDWQNNRIDAVPEAPEVLYHYTNAPALINILTTQELWATNAVYTNDQTEVLHSLNLLARIVNAEPVDRDKDVGVDMMLIAGEQFYTIVELYVACFCKRGDLLSQWRAYGLPGGYSLGFDSTALRGLTGHHAMLVPVEYDEEKQDRLVRDLVDRWRSVFKGADPEKFPINVRRLGAFVFAQAFLFLAATFKNDAFREEDEWRLVYRRQLVIDDGSGIKVKFRERKGLVASYAVFELPPPTRELQPIRHFIMGPTPNPSLAGFGLKGFLKSVGYADDAIRITPSVVPLRP